MALPHEKQEAKPVLSVLKNTEVLMFNESRRLDLLLHRKQKVTLEENWPLHNGFVAVKFTALFCSGLS